MAGQNYFVGKSLVGIVYFTDCRTSEKKELRVYDAFWSGLSPTTFEIHSYIFSKTDYENIKDAKFSYVS